MKKGTGSEHPTSSPLVFAPPLGACPPFSGATTQQHEFVPCIAEKLVHCHSLSLGCHWLCQCSLLLNDQGKNSKITGKASGSQSQNQALTKH